MQSLWDCHRFREDSLKIWMISSGIPISSQIWTQQTTQVRFYSSSRRLVSHLLTWESTNSRSGTLRVAHNFSHTHLVTDKLLLTSELISSLKLWIARLSKTGHSCMVKTATRHPHTTSNSAWLIQLKLSHSLAMRSLSLASLSWSDLGPLTQQLDWLLLKTETMKMTTIQELLRDTMRWFSFTASRKSF